MDGDRSESTPSEEPLDEDKVVNNDLDRSCDSYGVKIEPEKEELSSRLETPLEGVAEDGDVSKIKDMLATKLVGPRRR